MTPEVRKSIRIENPLSGAGFTSGNRARRFVAHGLAKWKEFGISIEFLRDPRDHRECSAMKHVDETKRGYDRASGSGMAGMEELANLPMVAPAVLLNFGRRKGASRHAFVASQGF